LAQAVFQDGSNQGFVLENDRFKIYNRCPMTDVAMAISTDADTDVAYLDHLVTNNHDW